MNVLALDLGTSCGWAVLRNGHREHGVENFAIRRHESLGMRWLKFRRWFEEMLGERPDLVVFERWVATRTGTASEITAGFTTRVTEYCDERHIVYCAVSPSDLKRWSTGKGNARKDQMMDAVSRRFQVRIDNADEADAYLLLRYAEQELLPLSTRG